MRNIRLYTLGILLLVLGVLPTNLQAQSDDFGWRLGFGIGSMSYFGDLSNDGRLSTILREHYQWQEREQNAYLFSLERRISSGVSLMMSVGRGAVSASDRSSPDNIYFTRALNFRSEITDYNLHFVYKSDNDKLLGEKFIIAPYLLTGIGLVKFRVFGDLKGPDGEVYNYLSGEPVLDGLYETELTNLGTELFDYNTFVPAFSAGIGLRLRIINRLSLHLQTDMRYLLSDHLDDVGTPTFKPYYDDAFQEYAGAPNPLYLGPRAKTNKRNDWYFHTSLSLRLSFGRKREGFKAPIFYTTTLPVPTTPSTTIKETTTKKITPKPPQTNDFPSSKVEEKTPKVLSKVGNATELGELQQEILTINKKLDELYTQKDSINVYLSKEQAMQTDLMTLLKEMRADMIVLNQKIERLSSQNNTFSSDSLSKQTVNQTKKTANTNTTEVSSKPPKKVQAPTTKNVISEELKDISIYFNKNSTVINEGESNKLEKIGTLLRSYPELKVLIIGYIEHSGSDYYNRKLSDRRARVVRDRLVNAYRVSPTQLSIKSNKDTQQHHLNNRQVDIIWVK